MNSWVGDGVRRGGFVFHARLTSVRVNPRVARGGDGGYRRWIKYLRGKYLENLSLSLFLYAITTPTIELLSGGTCYRQRIKRTTDKGREGRFENQICSNKRGSGWVIFVHRDDPWPFIRVSN